jgi:16S rRNA (guanine966-N2)-methyltransferase
MRIVAGAQRGRTLVAPKGHSTRPTADRTRQALFNVLEHAAWGPGLGGGRVIDLFAGSGALGLEALSRGGAFALLVDDDPAAITAIGDNIRSLGLDGCCAVLRRDAARLPPRALAGQAEPFDLAFLDPPYAKGLVEPALAALRQGGWLAPEALVVVEQGAGEAEPAVEGFEVLDGRLWGAARVWFLEMPVA